MAEILFMSAFGAATNPAQERKMTDQSNYVSAYCGIGQAPARWTSATPAQGELLQASLEALLQNDKNIEASYPISWVNNNSDNSGALCNMNYMPNSDTESYTISGDKGPLPTPFEEAAPTRTQICLGSTVPAYPFLEGTQWTCGLFGVSDGKPTWFGAQDEGAPIYVPNLYASVAHNVRANSNETDLSAKLNDVFTVDGNGLFDVLVSAGFKRN